MPLRKIIIPVRYKFVSRSGVHYVADAVSEIVGSFDYKVVMLHPEDIDVRMISPRKDIIFILDWMGYAILKKSLKEEIKCKKILYNLEPCPIFPDAPDLYHNRFRRYIKNITTAVEPDFILDYNGPTTKYWKTQGIRSELCPLGYHESFELNPEGKEKLPDSVFVLDRVKGDTTNSKRRYQTASKLVDSDVKTTSIDCSEDIPSLERLNVSDGIHLNVHHVAPPFTFGPIKIIVFGLSNKRFIVSEECIWYPEGLQDGVHWVLSKPKNIVQCCEYWMSRPQERKAIGLAGYEFIKKNHRLKDSLGNAFDRLKLI